MSTLDTCRVKYLTNDESFPKFFFLCRIWRKISLPSSGLLHVSCWFLVSLTFKSWRWRRCDLSKCRLNFLRTTRPFIPYHRTFFHFPFGPSSSSYQALSPFISTLAKSFLRLSLFISSSSRALKWLSRGTLYGEIRCSLQRAEQVRSGGGCISDNFKELQLFLCSEVLNFWTTPLAIQLSKSDGTFYVALSSILESQSTSE